MAAIAPMLETLGYDPNNNQPNYEKVPPFIFHFLGWVKMLQAEWKCSWWSRNVAGRAKICLHAEWKCSWPSKNVAGRPRGVEEQQGADGAGRNVGGELFLQIILGRFLQWLWCSVRFFAWGGICCWRWGERDFWRRWWSLKMRQKLTHKIDRWHNMLTAKNGFLLTKTSINLKIVLYTNR